MTITVRSLGLVVIALAVVAFLSFHYLRSSGSSGHPRLSGIRPSVTESQFRQVEMGDSKSEVAAKLGGEGQHYSSDMGPIQFDVAQPEAAGTGSVVNQKAELSISGDDCWLYTPIPRENPTDLVVVCFSGDTLSTLMSPYI